MAGVVIPATIVGALLIEAAGYPPCTLCLYQRVPYYVLTCVLAFLFLSRKTALYSRIERQFMLVILTTLLASAGLGGFHAGVEFGFWEGPKGCSGTLDSSNIEALLETLKQTKTVSCTKASFWIFGLSLSVWNAIISSALALVVAFGLIKCRAFKCGPEVDVI